MFKTGDIQVSITLKYALNMVTLKTVDVIMKLHIKMYEVLLKWVKITAFHINLNYNPFSFNCK